MKKDKKQRYFGLTKIRIGQRTSFISKEDKNGWSLGLDIGSRTVWLTNLRFKTIDHVISVIGDSTLKQIPLKSK